MLLLPKKVGPFTLTRKLGGDNVTQSFVGILDHPAGKQVVARRLLPAVVGDAQRMAEVDARIRDLQSLRHPALVPVLDLVAEEDERYLLEEHFEGVTLERVLSWCAAHRQPLPHNVYLNLATQLCNALEAMHARPGSASGAPHVLHLALQPSAVVVTPDGRVMLGDYGLLRSPTAMPQSGAAPAAGRMAYLSPEQTHPAQPLTPSSDLFSLGAVLFELLTLGPMFRADTALQTIQKVRRAEVTTHLLEVKGILPGLDKVLYRAVSLNPRHRYQRAFVLREDLRGLMAGYSFADIERTTLQLLAALHDGLPPASASPAGPPLDVHPSPPGADAPVARGPALSAHADVPAPAPPDPGAPPALRRPLALQPDPTRPHPTPRRPTTIQWVMAASAAVAAIVFLLVCLGIGGGGVFLVGCRGEGTPGPRPTASSVAAGP